MKRRDCSLCGGKLDRNNRCTLCGLDNTKNDDMYKHLINRNDCENAPLTHVHEESKKKSAPLKGGSIFTPDVKTYTPGNYQGSYQGKKKVLQKQSATSKSGKKNEKVKIIPLIFLIFSLIGSVGGLITELFDDAYYESEYEYETDYENEFEDLYSYVIDEMPTDGEFFEAVLEPGIYVVGGHIPQGIYEMDILEGESGYVSIRDIDNSIYATWDLEYWGNSYEEDIRLYEGAFFTVSNGIKLEISTTNAQPLTIEGKENELTETVVVTDGAIAGEDFEPGIYDVYYAGTNSEEWGGVDCTVFYDDGYGNLAETWINMYFNCEIGEETYHHVVIPKDAIINIYELENITLVPTKQIYVENLNDFYHVYY